MRALGLLVIAGCLVAGACGDDDDNTAGPSAAPIVFTAQLRPANEVPPVTNAESGTFGAVQITFEGSDAGAQTANFHIQLNGFPTGTRIVGAHIHPGAAGVNGPVAVGTGVSATTPFETTEGITAFNAANINVSAATAQAIIANPGAFYFNVHSQLNPGGVARGQLVRIQ